jgi:hypothetical protein
MEMGMRNAQSSALSPHHFSSYFTRGEKWKTDPGNVIMTTMYL